MKLLLAIATALVAAGCAADHPSDSRPEAAGRDYKEATASALVFASPVQSSLPLVGLDRGPREPSAFLGYDESITETFVIYSDDTQSDFPFLNSYNRDSITAKVGVRSR